MLNDPRLNRDKVRVMRRDHFKKRPVLSATIHPENQSAPLWPCQSVLA